MAAHRDVGAKHTVFYHQQMKANFRGVAFWGVNEQFIRISEERIGYIPTHLRITSLTEHKLCLILFNKTMHWSALESLGHEQRVK